MEPTIRPIRPSELDRLVEVLEIAAGRTLTSEALADAHATYEPDRLLAVFDEDGRLVGGSGSDQLELTVPGGDAVRVARMTLTGILPTHRHRGWMAALMHRQLVQARGYGESIAIGTTHLPRFLSTLHFSPADSAASIDMPVSRDTHAASDTTTRVRLVETRDFSQLLPDIFDQHRRTQPGQVSRRPAFWQLWLRDRPLFRTAPGDRFAVIYSDSTATPQGYLTYRLAPGSLRSQPVRALDIEELIAVTDEARHALWMYCATFDQASNVTASNVPPDEPFAWQVSDRAALRVNGVRDFLWLRLNNVRAALAARQYAVADGLVFAVADPLIAENNGCFRLDARAGEVECAAAIAAPDVALSVADLAATYLGGVTFRTLARAGRVTELTPNALDRADAMFRSAVAPWTVTDW